MYDDLITGPGKLKDWHFPASPSLFPDLILYSIIQIFRFNFMVSIVIYAIIQTIIISLLGIYIFKKTAPDRLKSYSWLVPCFFAFIFLEAYYFTHEIIMNQLLTSCFYHAGPFVNCLIAYTVFLNNWSKKIKYTFFILFSAFSVFNDQLFLVMFSVPFVLSALFTLNKTNRKHIIFCVLSVSVGTVIGLKVYQYVKNSGITHFLNPEHIYEFDSIIPALKLFSEQMYIYMQQWGFRSTHIILTFVSLPVIAILILFKRKSFSKEMNFFLVFCLIFSFTVLSAPIIAGNYIGFDNLRYNIACFYFSIITLTFFAAYLIEFVINKPKLKVAVSIAFLLVMLMLIGQKYSTKGLINYANYYPDNVRKLDSLSDKFQLKHGISQHGYSKVITIFSKKNIEVLAVYGDAGIADIGSNVNWYYDNDFDFVIIDKAMLTNPSKILDIKDTLYAGDYTVLRVGKFYYPKGSYYLVKR
jgi:hypothetical protein